AADVVDAGQLIDQLPFLEDGFEHLLGAHIFQRAAFPGGQRVEDGQGDRVLGVQLLVVDADIVGDRVAGLVKQAVQLFKVRVDDLLRALADLDFRDVLPVLLHRYQLVDAAEHRVGLAGNQPLTDAKAVYLRPLQNQVADDVLVQRVGGDDLDVREAGLVQHFSGALGEVSDVAAVDAHALRPVALRQDNLVKDLDGV